MRRRHIGLGVIAAFTLTGFHPANAATLPTLIINVVEDIGVDDGPQALPPIAIDVAEEIGVADGPALEPSLFISVDETIGVADASAAVPPAVIDVIEQIAVADGPQALLPIVVNVAEAIGVTDGPALEPSVYITVDETIAVADGPQALLPIEVNVAETIDVADGSALEPSVYITVNETIAVADAPAAVPPVVIDVIEQIAIADDPQALLPIEVNVAEVIGVTDGPALEPSVYITVNETIAVADDPQALLPVVINVAETIGVVDGPALEPSAFIAVEETIAVSDAVVVLPPLAIEVVENIEVADAVQALASVMIEVTETIGVTDAVQVLPPIAIDVTETIEVADAVATDASDVDTDGDGVTDSAEIAGPNGGDGNGDGTQDRLQANVASLPDVSGDAYVTVETAGGCTDLLDMVVVAESAIAAQDPVYDYPFGLLRFRLPCNSATIRAIFHGATSLSGPYRDHGPTVPGDFATIDWYTLLPTATFGTATIGGNTVAEVTLTLTDGELGDDTGTDGEIITLGGPAVECAENPAGLVSWWDADSVSGMTAPDIADGNNGVLKNGAFTAPGKVGQAFAFDGTDDFIEVPDSANLNPSSITIDAWVKRDAGAQLFVVVKRGTPVLGQTDDGYRLSVDAAGTLIFSIFDTVEMISTGLVAAEVFQHVAVTYDAATGMAAMYINGAPDKTQSVGSNQITPTTAALRVGAFTDFATGDPVLFNSGLIDEIEIYDRALMDAEILDIYDAGIVGKCKTCITVDCSGSDTGCAVASCDPTVLGDNCEILTPIAAGTECRASAGLCDVAEVCDGAGDACPADGFLPATTVCLGGRVRRRRLLLGRRCGLWRRYQEHGRMPRFGRVV
jgi:hypothetical protein